PLPQRIRLREDTTPTVKDRQSGISGDVISIIGSSGSGKSTFLRCINFLEKPSEGTIVVSGQNIGLVRDKDGQLKVADKNQLRLLRTRLTMVFQHFNLWSHM
ncbi:ATP-binding cassette domain-containing protein, partial [Pseudomonas aeruginosa]|nr:ATP-binding cassette domain-containing protein [Pseudomonas aeruginosa]